MLTGMCWRYSFFRLIVVNLKQSMVLLLEIAKDAPGQVQGGDPRSCSNMFWRQNEGNGGSTVMLQ